MNDAIASKSISAGNKTWFTWIAVLALIGGMAIGGLALLSALGIWIGLWDFRRGFALLGIANSYADLIAIITLLAAVAIFGLSRFFGGDNGLRLSAIALAGTVAAAFAYYVPESFRPAEGVNIPPIHDISTDTVNPPQYVDILPLRTNAANTTVYGGSEGLTHQSLAQQQTEAYPDLATRSFSEPPDAVFARALAAAEDLGWDIVTAAPEEGRIEATDTTFWFRFKDDVVIRIQPSAGGAILDARSLSRVGRGDVGKNANRLRAFFATL